ncbi:hypothetical protein B0T21DRAFT_326040 [Apiosordaria backusii]|uniref:Uncharacterized protein n=1 Tax=Apiosordaria backusii TaxID=314023 RepID=A0AA40K465_9PEZI|nr:hypothetical protein B0T21DRAFT_326040 [Apiosordaria backusii]
MLWGEQSRQSDLKRKAGTVGRTADMPMMWDRLKISQKQDDERIRLGMGYNNHNNAPKKGGRALSACRVPECGLGCSVLFWAATAPHAYLLPLQPPLPTAPSRLHLDIFQSLRQKVTITTSFTQISYLSTAADCIRLRFLVANSVTLCCSETTAPRAVIQEPPPRNPARIKVRTSTYRPPSSVYSQDTQPQPSVSDYTVTVATKYGYRYGGAEEISPPSSPEPDSEGVKRFLPGDVSPIEEDDHPTAIPQHQQTSPHHNTAQNGHSRQGQTPTPETGRQSPHRAPNSRGGATSIPMLRRERRKQSGTVVRETNSNNRDHPPRETGPAGQEPPRWDPLSGERTKVDRGRPSQVNPAEFSQGLGITATAWASPQPSPTVPPSFTDRVRRIAKKAAAGREREPQHDTDPAAGAFTSTRPGWRGASGRTAIVDPVRDTPEVAPLRIPEKSSRRTFTPVQAARPKPDLSLGAMPRRGQTPPISPPATETPTVRTGLRETSHNIVHTPSQQTPPTAYLPSENAQSYPSPPLSSTPLGGGDAPAMAARELARDAVPNLAALPSPTFNNTKSHESNMIRRKPPPVHTNHQHQESVSSVYSQPSQGPLHTSPLQIPGIAPPATLAANNDTYVQPPSRFSITTYATSNTGTTRDDGDDPVDEDQPPVPSLPVGLHHGGKIGPSSDNSPVTSPIDQFMTSPFSTHTEQLAMVNPAIARAQAIERPNSRASDINKSLPPAPPEGEAQDRVSLLNAQLRALANRRININRSITQMTEMMPTDKLMNSEEVIRKREIEKKKVEALKQELSEVQREEYELGLKLHRAYKRLDRDSEYEPTGLWVRRVTN